MSKVFPCIYFRLNISSGLSAPLLLLWRNVSGDSCQEESIPEKGLEHAQLFTEGRSGAQIGIYARQS